MGGWYSLLEGLDTFRLDLGLDAVLSRWNASKEGLERFSRYCNTAILDAVRAVEAMGGPRLVHWDVMGRPQWRVYLPDELLQSLEETVKGFRCISRATEEGDWHGHMAQLYLIGDAGYECILTVTAQTAYALKKYMPSMTREYRALAGLEGVEYGGTWFTEVEAGSDLARIESLARRADKGVRITGYKFFTSNVGLADHALILARREDGGEGVRGLGLYYLPRIHAGEPNYRVVRLKEKLGTLVVPTGEVMLEDSYAEPVGREDLGIYYALENLMISRLANSAGAVGLARRSLLEALAFASRRRVFGRLLIDQPIYRSDLGRLDARSFVALALTHKAVELWRRVAHEKPPYSSEYIHARIYNHLAKGYVAKEAVEITGEAMELLGGRGFLREHIVERLHREALVTTIWEGSTNIHVLDWLEALYRKRGIETLLPELEEAVGIAKLVDQKLAEEAKGTLIQLAKPMEGEELLLRAKKLFFSTARILGIKEAYEAAEKKEWGPEMLRNISAALGVDVSPTGPVSLEIPPT